MKNSILGICFILAIILNLSSCSSPDQISKIDKITAEVTSKYAPDKRIAVFEAKATKDTDGKIKLTGKTNLKDAHAFLLDTLSSLNVQITDSIRLLPDATIGEKSWGLVTLSAAPLRKHPAYSAEMVSQAIMGTPVKVFEKQGGWYLIQTPDQYIGWINSSSISTQTTSEHEAWKKSDRYVYNQNGGSVQSEPNENSEPVSDLVLGCIFEMTGKSKSYLHVQFPDGRSGYVKAADCITFNQWTSIQPVADKIIAEAKQLLGRPYLWGGTTTKGIDCSGFVKTAYYSQGVILARDASQQARYGEILDVSKFQFQPGDLLFFGRNKNHITHVGMYIGNNHYIHSSGRVQINSFNPDDEDFSLARKESLVSASRILNSLDSEQIISIKNHPWYN